MKKLWPLLLVFVLSIALSSGAAHAQEWWNESWEYRVPITVTEQAIIDHDNSMVEVTLDTYTLSTIQNKVRPDCGDIRVVNSSNNLIEYNVTKCGVINTKIRFRANIFSNFDGTFAYIYYNNSDATDASSAVPFWIRKRDKPTDAGDPASVVVGGEIYTFGGLSAKGSTNATEVYNPATDTWSKLADMPDKLYAHSASIVGNNIYIIGGWGLTDKVSVYYIKTDTWDKHVTNMSIKRFRHISEVVNNKIYIIGGYTNKVIKTVEEYDPSLDSWNSTKTNMPTARRDMASAVVDNKIYVIGGNPTSKKVEIYNPTADSWTTNTSMPTAKTSATAVAVDSKIYVFGSTKTVEIYDTDTDAWEEGPSMPSARSGVISEAINDRIYVIGDKNKTEEFTVPNWKLDVELGSEESYIMPEVCDGIDNDRDGDVDEVEDLTPPLCTNQIGVCANATKICGGEAGWLNCTSAEFLANNESYEEFERTCNDSLDNDCDDDIDMNDTDCLAPPPVNCTDADNDSFAVEGRACGPIDCDDADPAINPNATELCIGNVDEDCDGNVSNGCNVTQNITQQTLGSTPVCGDGKCDDTESILTCCVDCGVCPEGVVCGNGLCESGETPENCPSDCKSRAPLYAGISIIIAIIVIILVWWFLFRKPKQELSALTETHGIKTPAEASPQDVGSYISNCLSLGYSPDQIKDALLTKGWEEGTVNGLLSESHGNLTALGTLATKHKVETVHEDVGKVEKYVSDGLKQGFVPTEIKTKLKEVGWSEDVIEDAFAAQPGLTKELDKLAEKHKVAKPPRNKAKVPDFVKESLNKGHTTKEVKKKLEDVGWTPDVISEHLPKV